MITSHAVPVTALITIHQVLKAARELAENLEPERLSMSDAEEFILIGARIHERICEYKEKTEK